MAETLKDEGCVLLPLCPTGVIYDLLELIDIQLDQACFSFFFLVVSLSFFSSFFIFIDRLNAFSTGVFCSGDVVFF